MMQRIGSNAQAGPSGMSHWSQQSAQGFSRSIRWAACSMARPWGGLQVDAGGPLTPHCTPCAAREGGAAWQQQAAPPPRAARPPPLLTLQAWRSGGSAAAAAVRQPAEAAGVLHRPP
jgi:hypothetical protein